MARGNGGQDIFLDDSDFRRFKHLLGEVRDLLRFRLYSYCLMPNHFHLLVRTSEAPLSVIMHRLLFSYARYFNDKHKRKGHLFYERYKAILCTDNRYLSTLVRYIHRNPVKGGLARFPGEWPWSSHHEYLKGGPALADAGFVLPILGGLEAFREFAEKAFPDEEPYDPDCLRNNSFIRRPLRELAAGCATTRELAIKALEQGYRVSEVAAYAGCTPQNIHKLRRPVSV